MTHAGARIVGVLAVLGALSAGTAGAQPRAPRDGSRPSGAGTADAHTPDAGRARSGRASKVVCMDRRDCHGGVAMIGLLEDGRESAFCSAFLVAPDQLVTAAHCIPDAVQRGVARCRDAMRIHFPAWGGGPALNAVCGEVLHTSALLDRALMAIDYAVIHLARSIERPFFSLSRDGVTDRAASSLWVVDPPDEELGTPGLLLRKRCRAAQGTIDFPAFDRDDAAVVMLRDCGARGGNSGGAVVDARGVVRAVLIGTGRTSPGHLPGADDALASLVDWNGSMALATNLAAIPDLRRTHAPGDASRGWLEGTLVVALERRITPVFVATSRAKLRAAADARLAEWEAITRAPIAWRLSLRSARGVEARFDVEPACRTSAMPLPARMRVPVWRAELSVDADHKLIATARIDGARRVHIPRTLPTCSAPVR